MTNLQLQCGGTKHHIGSSDMITKEEIVPGRYVTKCMKEPLRGARSMLECRKRTRTCFRINTGPILAILTLAHSGTRRLRRSSICPFTCRTFLVCTETDVTKCPTLEQHRASVQAHLNKHHQDVKSSQVSCPHKEDRQKPNTTATTNKFANWYYGRPVYTTPR